MLGTVLSAPVRRKLQRVALHGICSKGLGASWCSYSPPVHQALALNKGEVIKRASRGGQGSSGTATRVWA